MALRAPALALAVAAAALAAILATVAPRLAVDALTVEELDEVASFPRKKELPKDGQERPRATTASGPPPPPSKIKTIVAVMLENRAFDHMCGYLSQWGVPVDGVNGTEFNIANGTKYFVQDQCPYVNPFDPFHGLNQTTIELMGQLHTWIDPAPMSGFAELHFQANLPEFYTVMHGFAPNLVPAISTLAKNFAVFDRWYSSLPGPTFPNRMFVHSGTSHGHTTDDNIDSIVMGLPQRTLFDVLNDNNVSWGVYYSDVSDTVLFRSMRSVANLERLHPIAQYYEDAAAGRLPSYAWVVPRFFPLNGAAQDQHPDHDVVLGEQFIADVYGALRNSSQWAEAAMILTYDEHGGFFDHVSPPMTHVPNPDGLNAGGSDPFNFTRLGVRVCTVVASPFIPAGTVVHEPANAPHSRYEHSSLFATLRRVFNLSEELTNRTRFAAPWDHIFSLETPRTDCPVTVPTPQVAADFADRMLAEQEAREPNHLQRSLVSVLESAHGLVASESPSLALITQRDLALYATNLMGQLLAPKTTGDERLPARDGNGN